MNLFYRCLPDWVRNYPRQHLRADLLAGAVVTVLVLPQSMAYAMLAGLPPQAGLYASILPVLAYALVGSSMTQAVGPVAITAIMTFSVLSPLAAPGSPQFASLAAALALLSGAMVLALGLFRLGFLSNLLSRPVVSGFISGSALLIVLSQLKVLLGLHPQGSHAWSLVVSLVHQLPHVHLTTVVLSAVSVAVLVGARSGLAALLMRLGVRHATAELVQRLVPVLLVLAGTSTVMAWNLDQAYGVAVVGQVPGGIAGLNFQLPGAENLGMLLLPALTLAFVGTVQNISMAQALANKRHERVDANRELVGLGSANVVAAFFGGMPVGGGLSRSAVNTSSGAQTPLASMVSAACMLGIVVLGTAWFSRIPQSVLAASIVVAAVSMVDVAEFRRAWAYDRADAFAFLGTAVGVLMLGLQTGIVLGVGLTLASLLYRSSVPHIAVVGRIEGTEHFRNVDRHGVQTLPNSLFLRIDESIFFGNLQAIEARLMAELARQPHLKDLVLIMSAVNRVDLSGLEALTEIERNLSVRGIDLHLAEVKGPVQDRLVPTLLWKALGTRVHLSAFTAYEFLQSAARRD